MCTCPFERWMCWWESIFRQRLSWLNCGTAERWNWILGFNSDFIRNKLWYLKGARHTGSDCHWGYVSQLWIMADVSSRCLLENELFLELSTFGFLEITSREFIDYSRLGVRWNEMRELELIFESMRCKWIIAGEIDIEYSSRRCL